MLQGSSFMQTVFLTPLMFGVAHIHHLVEMVTFQGVKHTSAVALVSFLYLTSQLSQAWSFITCILAVPDR